MTQVEPHGLHHVTAIARDPHSNVDFYTRVLGLRLVEQTVNFDAPDSYHLDDGDEQGRGVQRPRVLARLVKRAARSACRRCGSTRDDRVEGQGG